MIVTALALAVLAVLLAWPVPLLLAHARWTSRAPAAALLVWQSVALAGGLSMIGALLSYGMEPFGRNLPHALGAFVEAVAAGSLPAAANFSHMFALSSAILLGFHLVLNLVLTLLRAQSSRRRHRMLVSLLSRPGLDHADTRILDHAAPVAYCLPGTVRSVTVLSAGLIELLDDAQLRGVIAHENAHAFQRHHLVLLAFRAWRASLPWFPIATSAHTAVAVLVEMLADDRARRVVSDATLAASIALVATQGSGRRESSERSSTDDFASDSPAAAARIARLNASVRPLPIAGHATAITAAAALLAIPTILLLAPAVA